MATRAQHEQQARQNLGLHEHLAGLEAHLDWAVTALFYSALHYIDAFLLPIDPRSHRHRNEIISRHPQLATIYRQYRLLLDRSRDTRYECVYPTLDQLRFYRQQLYDPIQAHMVVLLQSSDTQ